MCGGIANSKRCRTLGEGHLSYGRFGVRIAFRYVQHNATNVRVHAATLRIFVVDARKFVCDTLFMRNGEMLAMKKRAVRLALSKTNCSWKSAAELLGMSANGVALFAKREKLVRPGRKLGEKAWVLA